MAGHATIAYTEQEQRQNPESSPLYTVYTIYTFYQETQLLTVQNKRSLIIPAPVKNQTSSFLSPVTIWLC